MTRPASGFSARTIHSASARRRPVLFVPGAAVNGRDSGLRIRGKAGSASGPGLRKSPRMRMLSGFACGPGSRATVPSGLSRSVQTVFANAARSR